MIDHAPMFGPPRRRRHLWHGTPRHGPSMTTSPASGTTLTATAIWHSSTRHYAQTTSDNRLVWLQAVRRPASGVHTLSARSLAAPGDAAPAMTPSTAGE